MFITTMKYAFFRLISISLFSIIILSAILIGLRFLGLSQQHSPLDHPLTNNSLEFSFKEVIPNKNSILNHEKMLSVNLWVTQDLNYVLYKKNGHIEKESYIFNTPFSTLDNLGYISLDNFFQNNPNTLVLLNILEQDPAKLFKFKALLEKHKKSNKVIIKSPYANVIKYLRKENPLWVFASNLSLQTQLMFMSALYIEPLAKINADFIITPYMHKKIPLITPRMLNEFKRRHIKVILENSKANQGLPQWLTSQVAGFIEP
ncbi:MAG: hypothetical protein HOO06_02415 [Bdellovibrionaceae bacterium]|nr:hypothetical protein [Pseudobdellovibrionaceae bacterium]